MPTAAREGDLGAWIDLSLVPALGPANYRSLLSAFGLPGNILAASHAQLTRVVPAALASAILSGDRADGILRSLEWAEQPGRFVLTLADERYPKRLYEIPDPPPVLYVQGDPKWLSVPALAIVGSRNATPGGLASAEQFAQACSDAGLTIISGLALGIDAAAHRGGLNGRGSTVAVMGTGSDNVYPKRNTALGGEIAARGALVTEFALGTPPVAGNFPRRNRLIAGLSRGVLVVEAAIASGSLITARLAAEQGRDVFAIPGSIHSPLSKGCHALIKQGAKLVDSAQDVLEELGLGAWTRQTPDHHISGHQSVLLQHMGYDPCDIDTLVTRSGLTAEAVSAMLLELELEGRVGGLTGGFYQRLA